jgi:hypothetical protein
LALETGLGTAIETRNGASKTTSKIDDKNQIEEQFISSYAFHRTTGGRVRETPVGEHLELENETDEQHHERAQLQNQK